MLRQSVDLYVELGIERVSLLAVDTCRYVWAAAGFSSSTTTPGLESSGRSTTRRNSSISGLRTSILRAANRGR